MKNMKQWIPLLLVAIAALATLVVSCSPPPTGYYPTTAPTAIAPSPIPTAIAPTPAPIPPSPPTPAPTQVTSNGCPPGRFVKASGKLSVSINPGEAMHINVSRRLPPEVASATPANESNYLLTLAPNVTSATIVIDGSAYAYPLSMKDAGVTCQIWAETALRGGNWPTLIPGIPTGIFEYHIPGGQEINQNAWPDIVYQVIWTDATGVHTWPNANGQGGSDVVPVYEKYQIGAGKNVMVEMKTGFYYHYNLACDGCTRGVEDNYVVKFSGTGARVVVPEGSVWAYSPNYPMSNLESDTHTDPNDRWPSFLPGWLNISGVTLISF